MRKDLFTQLDPAAPDALASAFACLLRRRGGLANSERGWSLAELESSEADYHWLAQWLSHQRRMTLAPALSTWSRHLDPHTKHTNAVVTGSILWLLFTEHVRRRGSEGNFWNALGLLPWDDGAASLLFLSDRNPTPAARETMQLAAEALGLRNVFGVDGTLPWFDTGFLQFGFTRTGFQRRLPEWLAGQLPTLSVRHLLGHFGAFTASHSFQDLWKRLVAYRRHNLTEAQLRLVLGNSPWILPEWIDDLVRVARERPALDTLNLAQTSESVPFLDEPRLVWTADGQAAFAADWINLDTLVLSATTYILRWGGEERARLVRQADGSFVPIGGPTVIFGLGHRRGVAALEELDGHTIAASQGLELWDDTEIVNLFDRSGRRAADPYNPKVSAAEEFSLCLPLFAAVEGPKSQMWPDPHRQFAFVRFPAKASVIVTAAGESLWSSDYLRVPPAPVSEAEVAVQFTATRPLRFVPWEPPPRGKLTVELEPSLALISAHWSGQKLAPGSVPGIFDIEVRAADLLWPVTVVLRIKRGNEVLPVRRKLEIPFQGTLWRTSTEVRVVEPKKILSTRVATSDEFRIRAPIKFGEESPELFLVEAGSIIGRVPTHVAPLGRLSGFGGRLVARRGPYNEVEETVLVAERVIDGGIVRNVRISAHEIQIDLTEDIAVREKHSVVLWTNRHQLVRVTPGVGRYPLTWSIPHQGEHGSIYGLAVFFDGVRLGAWFQLENWSDTLRTARMPAPVREAAIMLRWFRAPILAAEHVQFVRNFVRAHAAEVLAIWLGEEEVEAGSARFTLSPLASSWTNALEELIGRGQLAFDQAAADRWFRLMNPKSQLPDCGEAVVRAVWRLVQVSPQLAADFVHHWVDKVYRQHVGFAGVEEVRRELRRQLQPTPAQWTDLAQKVLHVDSQFLDALVMKAVQNQDRSASDRINLQLLSKHPAFRRQCAVRLF